VIDKNALRLTRGGPTLGTIATHFISPILAGFAQAGGDAGPGYNFDTNPNGNLALAESVHEDGRLQWVISSSDYMKALFLHFNFGYSYYTRSRYS
jgi:hypothetical protein